jgi:Na+/H+ antiporter NhaD/arsenite permease-like protein
LVTLGGLQGWWLKDIVAALNAKALFLGATGLTALTDNAALTYLGTLVPDISEQAKLALVSGAVAGGGLTVIANAPNPAGYGILQKSFGEDGISPLGLFLAALPATILSMIIYLIFLP